MRVFALQKLQIANPTAILTIAAREEFFFFALDFEIFFPIFLFYSVGSMDARTPYI